MNTRTSDAILARMMALHPKIIDLTLDRMWRLLAALGNPQDDLPPVIHVAGTNGKGSTQAMIRAGLEAAGKTVHAYTSPHLARFHERIRVAGSLISEEALSAREAAVDGVEEHTQHENGGGRAEVGREQGDDFRRMPVGIDDGRRCRRLGALCLAGPCRR